MEMTKSNDRNRLRHDWSKEAIALALEGEWQRATEVNQAILALYPDDVDAMNRLGKAFMELREYQKGQASSGGCRGKGALQHHCQEEFGQARTTGKCSGH